MKRTLVKGFLLGVIAALLIVNLVSTAPLTARAAQKTQYKVVLTDHSYPIFETELNKQATEGWEFVSMTESINGNQRYVIFKR